VALIVSWLGLWDELLSEGVADTDATRWLLLIVALILLGLAAAIASRAEPEGAGSDLVTAAGLAAIAAGGLIAFMPQLAVPVGLGGPAPEAPTSAWWNLELLIAGLALIGFGFSGAFTRGPTYVGAIGLLIFTFSVGMDLDDSSPAGKVLGWPLILIIVGAVILVASARPWLRRTSAE
jgi:hypothetical protein